MRRNIRLFGFAIITTTLLLLVADFLRHSSAEESVRSKVLPSPAGFSHNLSGTGKMVFAFGGRVTMVAEESSANAQGGSDFTPRYQIEGDNPTPDNQGMALSESVIVSSDTSADGSPTFRVDSPQCWLPVDQNSPALHFDFDKLWRLTKPVFLINGFGKADTLEIRSSVARLNPQTNLIFADDFFTLDTGDLHLEGESLTFDPSGSRIDFTPYHGVLRWSIRCSDGQVIRGDSDGSGSFEALENGDYLLILESDTSVRTHFPESSGLAGDIETPRLELRLSPDSDGAWRPRLAKMKQPTLWHSDDLQLRGDKSTISWHSDGQLSDMIIDGEINIVPNNGSFIKTTASDFAQLFASEQTVHLVGDVTIHRLDGSVKGERAILHSDSLTMQENVVVIGERGVARSDSFSADSDDNWKLDGNSYIEVNDNQISWLAADHLNLSADGVVDARGNFSAELLLNGQPTKLMSDSFSSMPQQHFNSSVGEYRINNADGNVVVENSDGLIIGDQLKQLDVERFEVSSSKNSKQPTRGHITSNGQQISFSASEVLFSNDVVEFNGSPQIEVPVKNLGLLRDVLLLSARKINYQSNEQHWLATENVVLQGAATGYGEQFDLDPEQMVLRGADLLNRELCKVSTILKDKTAVDIEGKLMRLHFDQSLTVTDNVLIQRKSDSIDWLRCNTFNANVTSGNAQGLVSGVIFDNTLKANSLSWDSIDEQQTFVLKGEPQLEHPQAKVFGDSIQLVPSLNTITAIGTEEAPANIQRSNGQSASGAWIKYNYQTQSLDARRAKFIDSK
ncbi:MAG: hypothetical protein H8E25_07870 [Planctomycetes bacterium]|nr:hypothetical protein [Planctomycetota bacterium]